MCVTNIVRGFSPTPCLNFPLCTAGKVQHDHDDHNVVSINFCDHIRHGDEDESESDEDIMGTVTEVSLDEYKFNNFDESIYIQYIIIIVYSMMMMMSYSKVNTVCIR